MRTRVTLSPVFSFLACALLAAFFLLSTLFGSREDARALELAQVDPGPLCGPELPPCGEGYRCTAGQDDCIAPGCSGYCVQAERVDGFSPTEEIPMGEDDYLRQVEVDCEGDPECIEGFVPDFDERREEFEGGDGLEAEREMDRAEEMEGGDQDGCEAGAEQMLRECEARISQTGMDPGVCRQGAEHFAQNCFGTVTVQYQEGPQEDKTGQIAYMLSNAVQLVIQNVTEYPELKDAAQVLSQLIVAVAGGDIGSVVPEAVRVLKEVKTILGVQDYHEGQGMGEPTPEMVQQFAGPMCGEMQRMFAMVHDEVLPFLEESGVKATVLSNL